MSRLPRSVRTLAGVLCSARTVALLAAVLVLISATVGTGIGPLDAGVDAAIGLVGALVEQAPAPGATGEEGPPATAAGPDVQHGVNRTAVERHVHRYVNEERTERGLAPLAWEPPLREVARYHSRDMATEGYFAHVAPDGETVQDRYRKFGYDCRVPTGEWRYATAGENIARFPYRARADGGAGANASTPEAALARAVVDGWLGSPGHRENLLAEHWRREAIGVHVTDERGRRVAYVTQNFC